MGVKNLTTYINKNIKLERQKWRVNKSYYYSLKRLNSSKINRFYQTNKGKKDDDEPGNINIIVDSRSFCYFLGRQMNWFIYDNIRFLKFLRKYVLLLLSIENLNKIIFIFDGVVEIRKRIKRKSRQEERIKNIKKFYNKIQTKNYKNGALLRPEVNLCASQLLLNTFIQYLLNIEKLFPNKIEIVSSVSKESDIYIAELANNINGYVISNDSDFYVYNIPGFIHLDSLKFPNFVNKNIYIEYELYTSDLLIDHLCISKEILPIFATLCSNDYLIVNNFQKFLDQVNHYHVTQESTFHIKNEYFKKLVNFILDICDDLKIKFNNENTDEFRQHQQMLIIEEIIKRKDKEINDDVEEEFKDNLIFSVNEFNLLNIKEYNIDPNLVSSEIVESYYSNNITTKLLKVIIDKRFRCNIYLENIDKVCCWNVTDDIRKQLYKLLISRNNLGLVHDSRLKESDIEIPQKYTITELIRDNTRFVERKVNILINNQFPETPEEQFTRYLEIFYSNISSIRKLPYYLIPISMILRFYLIKKIKCNLFIYDRNDKHYKKFINYYKDNDADTDKEEEEEEEEEDDDDDDKKEKYNNENNQQEKTPLYWYEFESLLASCIAALTFSFLNKECYKYYDERHSVLSSNSNSTEINNGNYKRENYYKKYCHNMFINLNWQNERCLQQKTSWGTEDFMQDIELYNNSIQVYSEFYSVLYINSHFLQALKISESQKQYQPFYSMHHYVWEETFYNMIQIFKNNEEKHDYIYNIFNQVFTLNESKSYSTPVNTNVNNDKYLYYLQKIYFKVLNAILYTD